MPLAVPAGTTVICMSSFVVRSVRADEWRVPRGSGWQRFEDPAAPIAFLETNEESRGQAGLLLAGAGGRGSQRGCEERQQIIAEGPDGEWVGNVVVLIEEAGTTDWAGFPVERKQGHLVGVYMRPEHRGCGADGGALRRGLGVGVGGRRGAGAASGAREQRAGGGFLPEGGVPGEWMDCARARECRGAGAGVRHRQAVIQACGSVELREGRRRTTDCPSTAYSPWHGNQE